MKIKLLFLVLFATINSFSQKKTINKFYFKEKDVSYSRIDYSNYGIADFFITMYEDTPENKLIESKAENYLKNIAQLYHRLYFFIKTPTGSVTEEKEELLSQFISILRIKENVSRVNLHINLSNFIPSPKYLLNINERTVFGDTLSINTQVNSKNIWKYL